MIDNKFSVEETEKLKELFNKQQFDSYTYFIFKKVKDLANGKYTVIDDNLYYTILVPRMADMLRSFKNIIQNLNDDEFIQRINIDYITIDELLKTLEKEYSGFKIIPK